MFELKLRNEEDDNFIIKTALINFNDITEEIYVKLPISEKEYITDLLDPFVIMSIYKMMRVGGDCHVKGKVSKSLLDNLTITKDIIIKTIAIIVYCIIVCI